MRGVRGGGCDTFSVDVAKETQLSDPVRVVRGLQSAQQLKKNTTIIYS